MLIRVRKMTDKTIRIVYERSGPRFQLSEQAVDAFLEKAGSQEYSRHDVKNGNIPRHHPALVEVVEKLGDKATKAWKSSDGRHTRERKLCISDPLPEDYKYVYRITEDYEYMYEILEENTTCLQLAKALPYVTDPTLSKEILDNLKHELCYFGRGCLHNTEQELKDMPSYLKVIFEV